MCPPRKAARRGNPSCLFRPDTLNWPTGCHSRFACDRKDINNLEKRNAASMFTDFNRNQFLKLALLIVTWQTLATRAAHLSGGGGGTKRHQEPQLVITPIGSFQSELVVEEPAPAATSPDSAGQLSLGSTGGDPFGDSESDLHSQIAAAVVAESMSNRQSGGQEPSLPVSGGFAPKAAAGYSAFGDDESDGGQDDAQQAADPEPFGFDSNIENSKVELSSSDMAASAGHHYHHNHYGAHGWLDMGAHTGKKGAFGWHDKHPVGGKGRR